MKTPTPLPWILWIASASCPAQTLVIGLFDYSNLSAKETARLTETAGLAFAHSGIQVLWLHCRGAMATPAGTSCESDTPVYQIAMRLQAGSPQGSNGDGMMPLGHAMVSAEGGRYASVFVPAVRARAAEFGLAFDLLLGYAVAHEAGHCLLGLSHSYAGLMRGTWNRKDAAEMARQSLHLTKQETRKIFARLAPTESTAPERARRP